MQPNAYLYLHNTIVSRSRSVWSNVVVAMLLGWVLAEPAWGLKPDELSQFTSKYYTVHTNLGKKEAREYALHMDRTFQQYTKRFSTFRRRDRQAMPLYLVRTRDDYISLLGAFGIDATYSGGMFFRSPAAHGLATWVEDLPQARVLETLQHEGFHQFANAYIGRELPVWVNEGLAEYFGDGLIVGKKMKLGFATQQRVETVGQAVREAGAIDFDDLLDTTSAQWHRNMEGGSGRGHLQYQQSWSIVYFLIHGNKGRYRKVFEQYLKLVSGGRKSGKAFRQAFGGQDTAAFRKRWETFILNLQPDAFTTTIARMQFLGWGLHYLHKSSSPAPTTLAELRQALQKIKFRMTSHSHGNETVTSSKEESMYRFTRSNGGVDEFKLLEAQGKGLLPRIVAPGLSPEPMLIWSKDRNGKLNPTMQYK